jgi:hypothetical protein
LVRSKLILWRGVKVEVNLVDLVLILIQVGVIIIIFVPPVTPLVSSSLKIQIGVKVHSLEGVQMGSSIRGSMVRSGMGVQVVRVHQFRVQVANQGVVLRG